MAPYLKTLDRFGNRIPRRTLYPPGAPYEGASTAPRIGYFGLHSGGPNVHIENSLEILRLRSRHFFANNPLAFGALESFVSNLIGIGITPRWQIEDKGLKRVIQQLWADSVLEMDADGVNDFYGQQALIALSWLLSGESFVRIKWYWDDNTLLVPVQFQILEADLFDETYHATLENGNKIRMSIEFNRRGKRVAYWPFREHPGETFLDSDNTSRIRIPANEILHIYRPTRPGQLRGVPRLTPSLAKLFQIDQADDAKGLRLKIQNLFGGFIKTPPGEEDYTPFPGDPDKQETTGEAEVIPLEPGLFPKLPAGCDVEFSSPPSGGETTEWEKMQRKDASRGVGTTYEQTTGDLSEVDFSSIRAGLVEFRRLCKMFQKQNLIHQFCMPVGRIWIDTAVLSGAIDIRDFFIQRRKYYRVTWHPDPFAYVDPSKDLETDIREVRAGFTSRAAKISERSSRDSEVVDQEIKEERAEGIIYDSDPSQTSRGGAYQGDKVKNNE